MKRGFRLGLTGGAAFVALVLAAPFLLPVGIYKAPIERSVSRATGRTFTIAGPLHVTLFPMLGIRADKIALANTPGGRALALATADDVRLDVKLWPLFSGRIEVTQIILDRPVISLEVDAQRHANWTIERAPRSGRDNSGPHMIGAAHFSGVEIVHGRVTYSNLHTGDTHAFDDVNAKLAFTEPDQPASIDGTLSFSRQRISFHANAATARSLLQDKIAAVDISFSCDLLRGDYKGTAAPDGVINGDLQIETPSVRRTTTWLGAHLPDGDGLGALSLSSHIEGDSRHADFTTLNLKLDGMTANGEIALDTNGAIPAIKGSLVADHIDINPYIEHPHSSGAPHPHRDDEEWSGKAITLDILKKTDADLTMDVGALTVRKLNIGKAHIAVALNDAHLKARLNPIALYGGSGKAELDVDARGTPVFHNNVEFDNVTLQSFLSDTIGVKQIEGVGTIKLDVTSRGANAATIMHGIDGRGSVAFRNGRVRGVDLDTVARTIQSLLGTAINPNTFTTYSAMTASFTATNGVLISNDFTLTGTVLNSTGSGIVDVGNRTIDFRIAPRATAIVAKQKLSIGVPFRIKGPWKHVRYTADVAAVANGILNNLETGKSPLKDLFGSSQPKAPNAPKKKHKSVGDALKNMLGIH
jgi:AsmA protein